RCGPGARRNSRQSACRPASGLSSVRDGRGVRQLQTGGSPEAKAPSPSGPATSAAALAVREPRPPESRRPVSTGRRIPHRRARQPQPGPTDRLPRQADSPQPGTGCVRRSPRSWRPPARSAAELEPPAPAAETTDFVIPARVSAPVPARRFERVRPAVGATFRFMAWLIRSLFGIASLILLLAVVAAIPIVNFLALGYLLE